MTKQKFSFLENIVFNVKTTRFHNFDYLLRLSKSTLYNKQMNISINSLEANYNE